MESKLRILVLEDTATDAEIQLRELRRNGIVHDARRVETEEHFLRELESWSPDLILADFSLPAFDGLSALALARERSPDVPFIFVTGTMGEEIAIESLKSGATDYVLKQGLGRLVPAVTRALREARDLRTRREMEEALRRETAERLRAMEELHEKNQLLIHQSRQAAMGEMIGHIAHQWRQPLNTLGLVIQKMEMFYNDQELEKDVFDDCVRHSLQLIRHMSQTVEDFRNFFKPEKEKRLFRANEAVAKTLSLMAARFKDEAIQVEVVEKSEAVMYGYPNEFSQVLLNLMNNARDVLTERRVERPKVTIEIRGDGACAAVSVSDNAGGVPEELIHRIFDPYFTTKGAQHGTGVGLFMSRNIIEKNMGGKLSVCNRGGGAEFTIELGSTAEIFAG